MLAHGIGTSDVEDVCGRVEVVSEGDVSPHAGTCPAGGDTHDLVSVPRAPAGELCCAGRRGRAGGPGHDPGAPLVDEDAGVPDRGVDLDRPVRIVPAVGASGS